VAGEGKAAGGLAAYMSKFNMGEFSDCPVFDGLYEVRRAPTAACARARTPPSARSPATHPPPTRARSFASRTRARPSTAPCA
jgi:hypothetical protein